MPRTTRSLIAQQDPMRRGKTAPIESKTSSPVQGNTLAPLTVDSAMAQLGDQLGTSLDLLESLYHRLSPILIPAPPSADGACEAAIASTGSSLAFQVDTHTNAIRSINAQLADILERINL